MNSADEILKKQQTVSLPSQKISDDVEKAAQMITEALRQGGKVFFVATAVQLEMHSTWKRNF